MQFEFSAAVNGDVWQVRAEKGRFFPNERVNDRPHKHYSMEFHCVFQGVEIIDLPAENRRIPLHPGQILLLPREYYHGVTTENSTVDRICFHLSSEKGAEKRNGFSAFLRQITQPLLFEDSYAMQLMELCRAEQLLPETPQRNARLGLLMISTALRLLSQEFETEAATNGNAAPTDQKWVVLDYIERHFTDSDGITGLAEALYLSPRQTSNLVKKYLGVDFKTAIRARRMELAEIYLRAGKLSLEEIAWQVGYRSYSGFQLCFKEHFGFTPSAWQSRERTMDSAAQSAEKHKSLDL